MHDLYTDGDGDKEIIAEYPGNVLRIYKKQFNELPWPLWQLLLLKNHKILYNPIAKCGSSSLKSALVSLSDIPPERKNLPLDSFTTGLQLGDLPIDEAKEILHDPSYLRFAVVRNPFDRLVSAYLEKFVVNRMDRNNQFHTSAVISAVLGVSTPTPDHFRKSITYSQFVDYIVRQPPQCLDPHWCPQHLYLQGAVYQVFELENLEVLYDELAARCGTPIQNFTQNVTRQDAELVAEAYRVAAEDLPHGNIASSCFYDPAIRRKVQSYFALDLTLTEAIGRRSDRPRAGGRPADA